MMSKYGHRTHNWFEAVVNKLGGEEEAERFLRGDLVAAEKWRMVFSEKWQSNSDGVHFPLVSDGTTGPEWIKRLENKGYSVDGYAKKLLKLPEFKPTNNMTAEIIVIRSEMFTGAERTTENIRAFAKANNYITPNPEVACLMRERFTDEEMRVMGCPTIAVMHDFVDDPHMSTKFLYLDSRNGHVKFGDAWFWPGSVWSDNTSFAFVASVKK